MTPETADTDGRIEDNLVIFIADALRRDYFPRAITDRGTTIPTVTDGIHTVSNTPSILGGVPPDDHECLAYDNDDVVQVPTVLDLHDHPDFDFDTSLYPSHKHPSLRRIFNYPPSQALGDMEPPFVYVERCVATHNIFGQCTGPHGWDADGSDDPREYPGEIGGGAYDSGKEYAMRMERGDDFGYKNDYEIGIIMAAARFFEVVGHLRERGLLEDTLVVFTSDHGEAFPEDGYARVMHGFDCPEVRKVATTFWQRNLPTVAAAVDERNRPFMSSDILDVWWPDIQDVFAEIDVTTSHDLTEEEREEIEAELKDLGYLR